ncbi:TOMM precursor leader peptide-binding protein [Ktedonospora formicarum]|uniref:SagD family biosynthesis docking scaffold protein n=1 Tax=Ktedonospora formicarum TaxID=2778364 RepID=A0A8J3I8M7_9CHLR|nr:TOMM precursor leader peptide-binding protein [Ktedonospora formicarum]GHO50661.1 SagD family biosynthesis docking scaffold protein [Ktedonospora formicarum]
MGEDKKRPIGLIGQGVVYQRVKRYVEHMYRIIPFTTENLPQQVATCGIMVYCSDIWTPRTLQKINQHCLQSGVALLPVYTQFGEGIIGPCVVPQEKGCATCAEFRKLGATFSDADRQLLHQYLYNEHELKVSQPWLSSFSTEILAALVGEEITAYLHRSSQVRTSLALLSISLETLDCCRHSFLPLSSCPDCGELSKDTAEMATITLQSRPKPVAFTYRTQQSETKTEQIFSTYVDERAGVIDALSIHERGLLPIVSCELHDQLGSVLGSGRTLCPEQSKVVSLLETMERYAGLYPRSKHTTVRASYHQLIQQEQQALDPTTLGLHSPERYEQYDQNHRHLTAFHQNLTCNWVWGYSFQHQSPILVPEHCAYYRIPVSKENPAFVSDSSNGCALGNCLEEAIFHGILEVVERDAFLLTWYAQLCLPRLNPSSVTDPMIRLLVEHLEGRSGYTIHILNATLDHAVPCLLLLGSDDQNRISMPKAQVAAGSHPHPEQALLRTLCELSEFFALPPQSYQRQRVHALEMLANSSLVKTLVDHPLVYHLPEAFDRLLFLHHPQPQQTFQEAFGDFYYHPPERMDLRDDLEYLISYYLKRGIDTIVVDQTAPEHIPCGLRCVKILMPGMLPMTFGHDNRRIVGLERLHQLPFALGYRNYPLSEAEINPYPHPFD